MSWLRLSQLRARSRLDYANSPCNNGISNYNLNKLQRVQHYLTRIVLACYVSLRVAHVLKTVCFHWFHYSRNCKLAPKPSRYFYPSSCTISHHSCTLICPGPAHSTSLRSSFVISLYHTHMSKRFW